MDFVIVFFRDVLDGPLYYVVAALCSILICSCIGYLGERYLNEKKLRLEHDATHADVSSSNNGTIPNEGAAASTQTQSDGSVANGSQVQNQSASVVNDAEPQKVDLSHTDELDGDPNEHVNYNVTTITSEELLDDDY